LIAAFGEAPPEKSESPRRSRMKRLQETIEAKPRPDVPRQLVIAFETPKLWMMQPPERQRIISSLANLLMQAAGDDPLEEDGDDVR
jgi:hypothetical protein